MARMDYASLGTKSGAYDLPRGPLYFVYGNQWVLDTIGFEYFSQQLQQAPPHDRGLVRLAFMVFLNAL